MRTRDPTNRFFANAYPAMEAVARMSRVVAVEVKRELAKVLWNLRNTNTNA
jgi:hypothetical protein